MELALGLGNSWLFIEGSTNGVAADTEWYDQVFVGEIQRGKLSVKIVS